MFLNLGIVSIDYSKQNYFQTSWWNKPNSYSYLSNNGWLYSGNPSRKYGEIYGTDDIIDIWLDLRDNKNGISFAKNGKNLGKAADINKDIEYRLAIGMYGDSKTIEVLSLEVTQ